MIVGKKIVALCMARIQDEAGHDYLTSLRDKLAPIGYNVFVYNTISTVEGEGWQNDPQLHVYELMDFDVIDVVVVFEDVLKNQELTNWLVQKGKNHGKPVIVIGEEQEGCISIQYNHTAAFADTVRHVVCGHQIRDIHFMAGTKGNKFSEQRLDAFKMVLEENDIPFDDSMVSYGDFWSGPAEAATKKLIEENRVPRAIVCANDKMAITVCAVLDKHGIRVPQDVAVTGFDGIPEIGFATPRITSCECSSDDLAQKTADVLLEIEHGTLREGKYYVPHRLSIAESCGCKGEKSASAFEHLNVVNDRFYRYQEEDVTMSQISAAIQSCDTIEQVAECIGHPIIYDMCCMVEEDFIDETINPKLAQNMVRAADRDMVLLFDSGLPKPCIPQKFPLKRIIISLEYMLENNRVLIFSALHYENIQMGYACFFFNEMSYGNFLKVPQISISLSTAIGGYRNARHKHFLMSQIDEMYRIDTLTGLRNRRGFMLEYRKMLQNKSEDESLTVLLADLDGLKGINDIYGHKEGDFAIRTVAQGLLKVCPPGTLLARYGGDEMLGVYLGTIDEEEIRTAFYQYFDEINAVSDIPYTIAASIGVYHTKKEDSLGFDQIVECADRIMYKEKQARKAGRK